MMMMEVWRWLTPLVGRELSKFIVDLKIFLVSWLEWKRLRVWGQGIALKRVLKHHRVYSDQRYH